MNSGVSGNRFVGMLFGNRTGCVAVCAAVAMIGAGCVNKPMGADRVGTQMAYRQIEANAISSGRPGAATIALLHRYDLDQLAESCPDEAVVKLHARAVSTGDRDLLFALAEMSYVAGERIRSSLKPWEPRDARDYYLGSAVYAYLFLFGEGTKQNMFDRRSRTACDLYNFGLGWALSERRGTNAVARLQDEKRRLPVGEIEWKLDVSHFPWPLDLAEEFLIADQFKVRGLSVRNREPGLGAPLIAVGKLNKDLRLRRAAPATAFLRLPDSLAKLSAGGAQGNLELYSVFDDDSVEIAGQKVPLEEDLTTPAASVLNQSFAWQVERLQFFTPGSGLKSQLIPSAPYRSGKIPIVFVHGTFSSPIWWAEMVNTLRADPELRRHYQIWMFLYGSSKPLVISATELRDALSAEIAKLDPDGKDPALRQMVLVGHSQGGLLCKLAVTDTGDKLWHVFSDKQPEELKLNPNQLAAVRRYCFFQALPFVSRVVFISTPHRGSYLAGGFVRNLVRKLVSTPASVLHKTADLMKPTEGLKLPLTLVGKKIPTSLDSMSPRNPVLLTLADIPTAPGVKAHSIIAIKGKQDPPEGGDGVVKYKSAHVDYVESELVVRSSHSCQDKPPTIEELRRILHDHLKWVRPPGYGCCDRFLLNEGEFNRSSVEELPVFGNPLNVF